MKQYLGQDVRSATRDLHREQMNRFGAEIEWLTNPGIIDEEVLGDAADSPEISFKCYKLAAFMIVELDQWSSRGQSRLSWAETFEKYGLPNEHRVAIRETFLPGKALMAYAPGILAMSEIFAATPVVATRDGTLKSEWNEIAHKAEKFGETTAKNGTMVQSLVRKYLAKPSREGASINEELLDEAKLKLDDVTGITTVTPISTLVEVADTVGLMALNHAEQRSGVCSALQAKPPSVHCGPNMFSAVWKAYGEATGRLIYPGIEVDTEKIPPQVTPEQKEVVKVVMEGIAASFFEQDTVNDSR